VANLKHQHVKDQQFQSELVENLHLLRKSTINYSNKFDSVLQEHICLLKSFRFRYKAKPDGACLINCLAVHIFENEDHAMKLKKKINDHIAENLEHYKASIVYPFVETVGVGKTSRKVEITTDDQMVEFLRSEDSYYAYGN